MENKETHTADSTYSKRVAVVSAFVFLLLGFIGFKLYFISFGEGPELRELSGRQVYKEVRVPAERGNIFSADNKLLATSMPVYDLFFDTQSPAKEDFENGVRPLSKKLAAAFGDKSAIEWERYLRAQHQRGNRYVRIAKKITFTELQEARKFPVFELGKYKGGLIYEQQNFRKMPLGRIAERTIGYDLQYSQAGIEGAFSTYLSGVDGLRLKQKISGGHYKPVGLGSDIEPKHGQDVVTTIDTKIQDVATKELLNALIRYEADHGCVVVMEVATGQVKAIANLGRTEKGTYYEKRNYAVWETTEPGSTFKLASLMIALDDGLVDTAQMVDTENGVYAIYNRKVKDSNVKYGQGGYGVISVAEAFRKSSNVGLVKVVYSAYKDKPSRFIDQLYKLGLHQPLGVEIKGEGKPQIPKPGDPNWSGVSLPWITFGYEVSFTPLQMLTLYNAVANNGKMVKPFFVKEIREGGKTIKKFETTVINPAICSQKTLAQLQHLLTGAVERGTAINIYNPNMPVAGKTGTCQLNYWRGEREYQASFAGYFPAENPVYSCIVVINKPNPLKGYYGNIVAAPVFRKIANEVFLQIPAEVFIPKNELALAETPAAMPEITSNKLPNLKGLSGNEALAILENLGLKTTVTGNGYVRAMYPHPGSPFIRNQSVKLVLQ